MRKIQLLILAFGFLIFTSCSRDIYVSYQPESANTGKLVLKPSVPTARTYLKIKH